MKTILQITPSGARCVDDYGDIMPETPSIMLNTFVSIEFDLRSEKRDDSGILERYLPDLETVTSWYFAVDRDYDRNTPPKILITDGITIDTSDTKTTLTVPIADTGTANLVEDMGSQPQRVYTCEIGGLDDQARMAVIWQFPITIKNRIYSSGSQPVPPEITFPQYYTAAEIKSLLSGKADKINVYTKSEIDSITGSIETQLAEI